MHTTNGLALVIPSPTSPEVKNSQGDCFLDVIESALERQDLRIDQLLIELIPRLLRLVPKLNKGHEG